MTSQSLFAVGVRLFAVWLALRALPFFTSLPVAFAAPGEGVGHFTWYAFGAAYVLVAALLWLFPMAVADKLVPRTTSESRLSLNAHELARVGACLIGLTLLAGALPALVEHFLPYLADLHRWGVMIQSFEPELAGLACELLLGALLIAKARSFAELAVPRESHPN